MNQPHIHRMFAKETYYFSHQTVYFDKTYGKIIEEKLKKIPFNWSIAMN